jgi:hypothetical protein
MRAILHIFIVITFLTGIIAPACGFMWGGQYSVIEICTAQGLEMRVVANDEAPDDHAPIMANNCDFCFANANLTGLLPEIAIIERIAFSAEKIRFGQYEDITLTRFNPNTSPRGPPSTV